MNYNRLKTSIQYVKGVGPKRVLRLNKLGVYTVEDILYLAPRRYIDRKSIKKIKDIRVGENVTIAGKVMGTGVRKTRSKGEVVMFVVKDDTDAISVSFFNRPDLKSRIKPGMQLLLTGSVSYYRGLQMVNPMLSIIEDGEIAGDILPVYPLTEGLNNWEVRKIVEEVLTSYRDQLTEYIPEFILKKYGYPSIPDAFVKLHFPERIEEAFVARERFIYEEFFLIQVLLGMRKKMRKMRMKGTVLKPLGTITKRFLSSLPFDLTLDQKKVIKEIEEDLSSPYPMIRLLQGDVGSGKTVVAIYSMLISVENGYQSAMMVPTEILAEQHYTRWRGLLENIGIKVALLTGSTPQKEKKHIYSRIEKGDINIVIGTHALISEEVKFKNLALAVIDEQHRFGVLQRKTFRDKGVFPNFLVMTATPIPRSLALSLYGDMDISIIREKPSGVTRVETHIVRPYEKEEVFKKIREEIDKGSQMYVVTPTIDSTKMELKSLEEAKSEILRYLPGLRVSVMHGRMSQKERNEIMERFLRHEIDILVSTTVIEVGLDIKNARVMIIYHPERFGLAQLHQLRGRIGRGGEESHCFLFLEKRVDKEVYSRLKYFAETQDGFQLSIKDMEIRGAGEIMGTRQHGILDFKIADIVRDEHILYNAREDSQYIVERDPYLKNFPELRSKIIEKFKGKVELMEAG